MHDMRVSRRLLSTDKGRGKREMGAQEIYIERVCVREVELLCGTRKEISTLCDKAKGKRGRRDLVVLMNVC